MNYAAVSSDCIKEANRSTRTPERVAQRLDPFEVIRPLLHPPINTDLLMPIDLPPGATLRPYQLIGIKFLMEHFAALLADEMGLGKTIQSVFAARLLFRKGTITRALIVCPRSLLQTWSHELEKWSPELYVSRVRGAQDLRLQQWRTTPHVLLTTYETLREDIQLLGSGFKAYDLIILDEAQRIKNERAGVTLAVQSLSGKYRWALTGTPLENKVEDVLSIFRFLQPSLFRPGATPSPYVVREAIRPYMLRRHKQEVLKELPSKTIQEYWLELTPPQRQSYERMEYNKVSEIRHLGESASVLHVFALIKELKSICNFDPATGKSCKVDFIADYIDNEMESDEKALIFSQFVERDVKNLEKDLTRYNPLVFFGGLSDSQREAVVRDFQGDEMSKRILIVSLKAGGTGITLHRANHVVLFDHWWTPASDWQAMDRVHRIGQTREVYVSSLFVENTIEQRIYNLLEKKRELFASVIDDLSDDNMCLVNNPGQVKNGVGGVSGRGSMIWPVWV